MGAIMAFYSESYLGLPACMSSLVALVVALVAVLSPAWAVCMCARVVWCAPCFCTLWEHGSRLNTIRAPCPALPCVPLLLLLRCSGLGYWRQRCCKW